MVALSFDMYGHIKWLTLHSSRQWCTWCLTSWNRGQESVYSSKDRDAKFHVWELFQRLSFSLLLCVTRLTETSNVWTNSPWSLTTTTIRMVLNHTWGNVSLKAAGILILTRDKHSSSPVFSRSVPELETGSNTLICLQSHPRYLVTTVWLSGAFVTTEGTFFIPEWAQCLYVTLKLNTVGWQIFLYFIRFVEPSGEFWIPNSVNHHFCFLKWNEPHVVGRAGLTPRWP